MVLVSTGVVGSILRTGAGLEAGRLTGMGALKEVPPIGWLNLCARASRGQTTNTRAVTTIMVLVMLRFLVFIIKYYFIMIYFFIVAGTILIL